MTFLQERLKKMGASEAQRNSATVKLVEQAIADEAGFVDKAALEQLTRIADTYNNAEEKAADIKAEYNAAVASVKRDAEFTKGEMLKAIHKYEEAKKSADGLIHDKDLAEAVKAYKAVLEATKEVFGEAIEKHGSTDSMVAAINAASYIAWRGIMGPAVDNVKAKRML